MTQEQREAPQKQRTFDVEVFISTILRIGIVTSAIVIIAGLVLFLVTGNSGYPGDTFPTDLSEIVRGFIELKPVAIIEIGLILLILTPVLRIVTALIAFWVEKDYRYVTISVVVLVILAISFAIGKA